MISSFKINDDEIDMILLSTENQKIVCLYSFKYCFQGCKWQAIPNMLILSHSLIHLDGQITKCFNNKMCKSFAKCYLMLLNVPSIRQRNQLGFGIYMKAKLKILFIVKHAEKIQLSQTNSLICN